MQFFDQDCVFNISRSSLYQLVRQYHDTRPSDTRVARKPQILGSSSSRVCTINFIQRTQLNLSLVTAQRTIETACSKPLGIWFWTPSLRGCFSLSDFFMDGFEHLEKQKYNGKCNSINIATSLVTIRIRWKSALRFQVRKPSIAGCV